MGAGRPTKYDPKYCQVAIDYLAQGNSVTQLSAHIDVSKSTIYLWAEHYKEFSDALTRGQELSEAYWQNELVSMMRERDVNAPLVKLYFANRFNWTDKQSHDHTSKGERLKMPQFVPPDESTD
jgi:transposase